MHSTMRHRQNGAVLLVSLIILLIMTVIGTSGITSVTMEERMVSNMYDDNLSFQTSETGLRDCEDFLYLQNMDPVKQQAVLNAGSAPDSDTTIWRADDPGDWADTITSPSPSNVWTGQEGLNFWWQDPKFWQQKGMEYSDSPLDTVQTDLRNLAQGAVAANPRCIREFVAFQPDDRQESILKGKGWYHYQATTAASGGDIRSMSVVQSAYFKRFK